MSCLDREHILEIEDLSIAFTQYEKGLRQIDLPVISRLNVSVHKGEIVAVVGSSGSGKSLLAHAVMGILPPNANVRGRIYFQDELLDAAAINRLRGREIALVPQSVNYLDPLMKVGKQVRQNKGDSETLAQQRRLFQRYDLGPEVENLYPFELSGGMARRVLLASALMGDPKLIIADEPTPGLHLALAKKALQDFRRFADEGKGVLLITHDIELALEVADRIAVFYAGTTVEEAKTEDFAAEATLRHPYTKALWRALPQNGFTALPGNQPYVKDMPQGCPFAPRCQWFTPECRGEIPLKIVRCGTFRCVHGEEGEPHQHHQHGGKYHHHHGEECHTR